MLHLLSVLYLVIAWKFISDIQMSETPTLSEASVMNDFDVDMYDDLKGSYAHMLTACRQYLGTIDLKEVMFFLQTIVTDMSFNCCETLDQVIEHMGNHFHVFIQHRVN